MPCLLLPPVSTKRSGGSGFRALVNGKLVGGSDLDKELQDTDVTKISATEELVTAMETLATGSRKPPEEDVLIDGQSYYTVREVNPWDCESVLSTYSNLDNRPATIEAGGGRRKKIKKKKPDLEAVQEDEARRVARDIIQLSGKTGMPVGVLEAKARKEAGVGGVNKGEGRKKGETKEEKRARKAAVKREREARRMEKKGTRAVFSEAVEKRRGRGNDDELRGKTVFRY